MHGVRPPEGIGRRRDASRGSTSNPPLPRDRRAVPPADRRRVGLGGQHLHQRRLRQLARRQVRQERRLGEVVGRARAPAPGQFNLPHAIAIDRNDNIYVGDRSNRRIQVFDTDGKFLRMFTIDVPPGAGHARRQRQHADRRASGRGRSARPIRSASRRDRTRCCSSARARSPAASSRCRSTGKVLGVIGRSGRQLKQFSGAHAAGVPVGDTRSTRPRRRTGACRS